MEIFKQDKVLNEIISAVTHGKKKSGDKILARDYNLASKQMGMIFKTLSDNDIIEQTASNCYVLTENCTENAQEFYYSKIIKSVEQLKMFADVANIPSNLLIDILKQGLDT